MPRGSPVHTKEFMKDSEMKASGTCECKKTHKYKSRKTGCKSA